VKNLRGRFGYLFSNDMYLACTLLDHRNRNFEFILNIKECLERAKAYIIKFYNERIEKSGGIADAQKNPTRSQAYNTNQATQPSEGHPKL